MCTDADADKRFGVGALDCVRGSKFFLFLLSLKIAGFRGWKMVALLTMSVKLF